MIVFLIFTGCIIMFLLMINFFGHDRLKEEDHRMIGFFISAFSILFGIFLTSYVSGKEPSAIDVYKGKTELQYNYKIVGNDTTITDLKVVFKK